MINRVSFFTLSLVLSLTVSLSQAQLTEAQIDSLRQKAEQGDAEYQTLLGHAYYHGRGVPKDDTEAVKWYRKAAEQNNALAQGQLGYAYFYGLGVPQDYVLAHMWSNLAASQRGGELAANHRDMVAERMTRGQISKAQRLAREWAEKHRK